VRAALFDVGYTLMDEGPRLEAALRWIAQRVGGDVLSWRSLYEAACRAPDGRHPSLLVQMLGARGVAFPDAVRLREELPWDAVPLVPYPDAAAAVERLRAAGLRVGVLANQPASARDDLARAGLLPLLDGVWLSEAEGLAKPDPAFFRLALHAWDLPPESVAYVGDRPDNDVAPARRLGLVAVRVRLGPHRAQAPRTPEEEAELDAPDLTGAARLLGA
jgi:FMN phosphatase YigB (HAD superfamily)